MTANRARAGFALLAVAYVGLRLAAFLPASPLTFNDTHTYVDLTAEPLLSKAFLAAGRPWTVPLLYKLLPDSDVARGVGQLVLSIACWLALAAALAACVRDRRLRLLAFALVLIFSLSLPVTQWDRVVLSESPALSLGAAVLAAWLMLVRAPGWWTIAAVLGATLLWTSARDVNAWVAVLAVPVVLAWATRPGLRAPRIVLAGGLAAIFVGNMLLMGGPATPHHRWEIPLLNVIGSRVVSDPAQLKWFRDRGMPVPAVLHRPRERELGFEIYAGPLARDPRLDSFRRWVHDQGRRTLATFLLAHPYRTVEIVVRDRAEVLGGERRLVAYAAPGASRILLAPLAWVAYPPHAAVLIWLVLLLPAAWWLARGGRARPVWLVPGVALLVQFPHALIAWHGDSAEVGRHALLVGVMTRLSLLVLTVFLLDALLAHRVREPVHLSNETRED